jgi:hypothetical protein
MDPIFLTNKNHQISLTKKQKEAISERLAEFFFDFWQNKQNESADKIMDRKSQIVALGSGSRNFPENPRATI